MRPESSDISYLWDMLDASMAIRQFLVGKTFDDYDTDRLLRGAVERHIEIIGEAARNVSADFQARHPEIPWMKIIAQRNVLAHEYGEVKHERIWSVAEIHIPQLINLLDPLIPEPPAQDT
ncbi:MAG TPA: HepT-like ribonuclease domain-containing protein [Sedimentisphaerales bacterium]|nr:HepT-like ribonuclease domain-containing protein [Sedimentisphaerales bacterium]